MARVPTFERGMKIVAETLIVEVAAQPQ